MFVNMCASNCFGFPPVRFVLPLSPPLILTDFLSVVLRWDNHVRLEAAKHSSNSNYAETRRTTLHLFVYFHHANWSTPYTNTEDVSLAVAQFILMLGDVSALGVIAGAVKIRSSLTLIEFSFLSDYSNVFLMMLPAVSKFWCNVISPHTAELILNFIFLSMRVWSSKIVIFFSLSFDIINIITGWMWSALRNSKILISPDCVARKYSPREKIIRRMTKCFLGKQTKKISFICLIELLLRLQVLPRP